jgi:DNA-binding GntR family transcriptional regulator
MADSRRENSVVDALVDALRYDIMTGQLRPGQRIDQDEWADRVGASRTPVRAALERLEAEGFVRLSGRRGAMIIDVTMTHVEDVLSTRLVLDAVLGRVAAGNLDRKDLEFLHSMLVQIEGVSLPEGYAEIVEPARRFHARLYQAAAAPMLGRLVLQSVHHTNVFLSGRWFTNRRIAYVSKAYFSELYQALEGKNLDRVERLIRDWRVDMAGMVLQDRVRAADLRILPSVLTETEFERLRGIIDDGKDPQGPSIESVSADRAALEMGGARARSQSGSASGVCSSSVVTGGRDQPTSRRGLVPPRRHASCG